MHIFLLFFVDFHFTLPVCLNGESVIGVEMEFDLLGLAILTDLLAYSKLLEPFWSYDWNHPTRAKLSFNLRFITHQST